MEWVTKEEEQSLVDLRKQILLASSKLKNAARELDDSFRKNFDKANPSDGKTDEILHINIDHINKSAILLSNIQIKTIRETCQSLDELKHRYNDILYN
jgi:ribosomal protein L25 (general stress protein Ctc)